MATSSDSRIAHLLQRWHRGEQPALDELLAAELPWITDLVRGRLGPLLRARGETGDFVQDAIVRVVRDGPRFVVDDPRQFRALVARIVENLLRDELDRLTAGRRDVRREERLRSESVLDLTASGAITSPTKAAAADEWQALVCLALEFVAPADREILLLRQWQELPFETIAQRLGISAKAAHMRFTRALPRLVERIRLLRAGRLAEILDGEPPAA
jgi:RNA polymerase sigma-70 factor (ECF subfamily)